MVRAVATISVESFRIQLTEPESPAKAGFSFFNIPILSIKLFAAG